MESSWYDILCNTAYEDEKRENVNGSFIPVEKISNMDSVDILRNVTGLDAGESETLILYREKNADIRLIDEHKGRGIAKKMSVEYIGTAGILMLAFDKGIITAEETKVY